MYRWWKKRRTPASSLEFLGILTDMVKMEFSLPETKVKKLRFLLARFLQKRKVLLKEMQSLLGLLPFTCWIMPIGRIFSCQLSLAISGLKSPYAHIRLSCSLKENLRVRACFLESYNRRLSFQQEFVSAPDFRLFTDAAGSKGFGAIWKTHWCCAALLGRIIGYARMRPKM